MVRLVSTDHKQIDKQKILRTQRQNRQENLSVLSLSDCLFFQVAYPIWAVPCTGSVFRLPVFSGCLSCTGNTPAWAAVFSGCLKFPSVYGCCALVPMRLRLL
ncbi:MAG: hypothetical protein IJR44_03090 [Neisseriaceae bacterium]|nr:hypothetical protein [Neisseriaceae bacterium]